VRSKVKPSFLLCIAGSRMAKMSIEAELSAARAHLRSLQDKLRLAQAQVIWSRKAIAESQEAIAKLDRMVEQERAALNAKKGGLSPQRSRRSLTPREHTGDLTLNGRKRRRGSRESWRPFLINQAVIAKR
jgi:hypothetical protein